MVGVSSGSAPRRPFLISLLGVLFGSRRSQESFEPSVAR
jgi:hypothetical protein